MEYTGYFRSGEPEGRPIKIPEREQNKQFAQASLMVAQAKMQTRTVAEYDFQQNHIEFNHLAVLRYNPLHPWFLNM